MKLWIGKKTYELSKTNETTGETIIPDEMKQMDVAPFIDPKAGRTLVPIRFVAEALGAQVSWDGANRIVSITLGDRTIQVPVPKYDKNGKPINPEKYKYYIVNGVKESMDTYAQIKEVEGGGGRTFLPLRFVLEALGADVLWNGAERSITVTLNELQEIQNIVKEINWSYEVNGVSLKDRKNLCMPLNKSVSSLISDKDLAEYLEEKGLTLTSETKNGFPILADALLNLTPNVSDNILKGISDRSVIEYLVSYDKTASASGKDDLTNLLNKNISSLKDKYGYSINSAAEIIKGVLKASGLGYVKPLKTYEEVLTVSESLKDMMDNRLYKEDDKGNKVTLEELINEDRVLTFTSLNSLHNDVKANLLLSQSRELTELAKKKELSQVKDFLDVIYSAMNSAVNIEGEDVKEEDTIPFKQVIEQLDPVSWESNNKGDFLLNTYNKLKEMNISVKNNPKLFFALSIYRSLLSNNYKTVSDKDKEKITEMLITSSARTFEYLTKVQKFREAINSKDMKTIDDLLNNNYFGFQNQSKQDQEAIMKGIEFMIKEGVSDTNFNKLSIMSLAQLYSLNVNRLKWINQALKKGESLYDTLTQNIDFSTEDITKAEQSLFLRLLEISGHKVRDVIPPNTNWTTKPEWQMLKNPDVQLNILNNNKSKGITAGGIISNNVGFSFVFTVKEKYGGLWPNGQSLVEKIDYSKITDWKNTHSFDQLLKSLNLLTSATANAGTPKLRPPVRYGVNDIEQTLLNLLGVPTVEIYGGKDPIRHKKSFNLYVFSDINERVSIDKSGALMAEEFLNPSSEYKLINEDWRREVKYIDLFNSNLKDSTDLIYHNVLSINSADIFSKITMLTIPDNWKKDEYKIGADKIFYT